MDRAEGEMEEDGGRGRGRGCLVSQVSCSKNATALARRRAAVKIVDGVNI